MKTRYRSYLAKDDSGRITAHKEKNGKIWIAIDNGCSSHDITLSVKEAKEVIKIIQEVVRDYGESVC